jgi:NadR type nicotinamide-nucleotide adenylyltransferase
MRKIVIIGPESTGKSTLCQQLAAHYGTAWCPEYARDFLQQKGMHYSYSDLSAIAKGQQQLEESILQKAVPPFYFIDTNQYVMKVWCEVVFENCHPWIIQQIAVQQYDYYLLCDVDLPWIQDGLREYPDLAQRQCLLAMYKDILVNDGTPWALISGTASERLQRAVSVLDAAFRLESSAL